MKEYSKSMDMYEFKEYGIRIVTEMSLKKVCESNKICMIM